MSELPKDFGPNHPDWSIPSKRNKYFLDQRKEKLAKRRELITRGLKDPEPPKTLCFTTMVSGPYQWYAPLFIDRLKKEYPEHSVKVLLRGENKLKNVDWIWETYSDSIIEYNDAYDKNDGYLTAVMRFLVGDEFFGNYDYVLIMDSDILVKREEPDVIEQHLFDMQKNGLKCYDNYTVNRKENIPILPGGAHFVTREWWPRTAEVRKKHLERVTTMGKDIPYLTDEETIGCIITESGLEAPPKQPNLWAIHGIHLGYYRIKLSRKNTTRTDASDQEYATRLFQDEEFMELVDRCGMEVPEISEIFDILGKDSNVKL